MRIGVLALQGASAAHADALPRLGAEAVEVRTPAQLDDVDGVVLPGGESTTISFLLDSNGLRAPLAERLDDGLPAFGTCAGMILLASDVLDGRPDQRSFGVIDVMIACWRFRILSSRFASGICDLSLATPGSMPSTPPMPPSPAVSVTVPASDPPKRRRAISAKHS